MFQDKEESFVQPVHPTLMQVEKRQKEQMCHGSGHRGTGQSTARQPDNSPTHLSSVQHTLGGLEEQANRACGWKRGDAGTQRNRRHFFLPDFQLEV